jgi:DNA-binding XRE family transcriptional regulator
MKAKSHKPIESEADSGNSRQDAVYRRPYRSHESGGVIMAKKRKPTTDAIEILDRRYYQGRPDRLAALEAARTDDEVARKIYQLRTKAELSQRALAKLVGTTASVICRLEDADYEGHSLPMLRRIAAALDRRVEIRFVAIRAKPRYASDHGHPTP